MRRTSKNLLLGLIGVCVCTLTCCVLRSSQQRNGTTEIIFGEFPFEGTEFRGMRIRYVVRLEPSLLRKYGLTEAEVREAFVAMREEEEARTIAVAAGKNPGPRNEPTDERIIGLLREGVCVETHVLKDGRWRVECSVPYVLAPDTSEAVQGP